MKTTKTIFTYRPGEIEFAVTIQTDPLGEPFYTICMGAGFDTTNNNGCSNGCSVNVESPLLNESEYHVIVGQLIDCMKDKKEICRKYIASIELRQ